MSVFDVCSALHCSVKRLQTLVVKEGWWEGSDRSYGYAYTHIMNTLFVYARHVTYWYVYAQTYPKGQIVLFYNQPHTPGSVQIPAPRSAIP